jgi:hypothetical protein
MAGLNF